jgi:hypothetical protein
MIIEDKLNNVREALNRYDSKGVFEKKIFESILDIIQDISCEIEELYEIIKV